MKDMHQIQMGGQCCRFNEQELHYNAQNTRKYKVI